METKEYVKNNLLKINNHSNGITLISLVITIIILLILAGIVIHLAIGENGIIKMAELAGKNYINSQAIEESELAKLDNEIDNYFINNEKDLGENKTYLYNDGKEFEEITGSWEGYIYKYPGSIYNTLAGYFEKGKHTLNFGDNSSSDYGDGGFMTKNKIDLSQYSKLYIDVASFSCNFIPRSGYPNAWNGWQVYCGDNVFHHIKYNQKTSTSGIIEIDLTNINYNDILKFHTCCSYWGANGGYLASCSIISIWLEK